MKRLILILFSFGVFVFLAQFLSGDYRIWVIFPRLGLFLWVAAMMGILQVILAVPGVVFVGAIVVLLKRNHWSLHSFFKEFSAFEIRFVFSCLLVALCFFVTEVLLGGMSYLVPTARAVLLLGALVLLVLELNTKTVLKLLWGREFFAEAYPQEAPFKESAIFSMAPRLRAYFFEGDTVAKRRKIAAWIVFAILVVILFVPIFNHKSLLIRCSFDFHGGYSNCRPRFKLPELPGSTPKSIDILF